MLTKNELIKNLKPNSEIANYPYIYIYIYSKLEKNREVNFETINDIVKIKHSTDGFTRGALIEHKLDLKHKSDGLKKSKKQLFTDYPKKLMQNGEYLPRYRIALSQIDGECYVFDGYNEESDEPIEKFNYIVSPEIFLKYSESNENIKYEVDEFNILGLADKYYSNNPNARKIDFFGDDKIKGFIRIENDKFNIFRGDDEDFKHMMDVLNDPTSQKILGAFYTPDEYTKLSTKLIRNAIKDSRNEGYDDYVIIDRCAGTGNLQKFLTKEELTHCILNTYEAKEWLVLASIYENKVFSIIPPTYEKEEYGSFLMKGGDALSEVCIEKIKESIRRYVDKRKVKKLAVIFLENPPYSDSTSNSDTSYTGTKNRGNKSFVKDNMSRKGYNKQPNDLFNQFVWSADYFFDWYAYILYGPVKYFKSFQEKYILEKEFKKGYILNRKFFHATESGISLIYWRNQPQINKIVTLENPHTKKDVNVYRIEKKISDLVKNSDKENDDEIPFLAEMVVQLQIHRQHGMLQSEFLSKGHVSYTKIYEDNLLENLPLFASNFYPLKDFTEKDVLYKSGDLGLEYTKDEKFLQDCLVWTLMTNKQRCENPEFYEVGYGLYKENELHLLLFLKWNAVEKQIKANKLKLSKSLYYIEKEYDLSSKNEDTGKPIWKYEVLHNCITELKEELDKFYDENIKGKMIQYQLVK